MSVLIKGLRKLCTRLRDGLVLLPKLLKQLACALLRVGLGPCRLPGRPGDGWRGLGDHDTVESDTRGGFLVFRAALRLEDID